MEKKKHTEGGERRFLKERERKKGIRTKLSERPVTIRRPRMFETSHDKPKTCLPSLSLSVVDKERYEKERKKEGRKGFQGQIQRERMI